MEGCPEGRGAEQVHILASAAHPHRFPMGKGSAGGATFPSSSSSSSSKARALPGLSPAAGSPHPQLTPTEDLTTTGGHSRPSCRPGHTASSVTWSCGAGCAALAA